MDWLSVGLYIKMGCANFLLDFQAVHMVREGDTITRFGRRVQAETVHRYISAACQLLPLTDVCVSVSVTTRNKLVLKTRFTFVFRSIFFLQEMKQMHLRVNNSFLKNTVTVKNDVTCVLQ